MEPCKYVRIIISDSPQAEGAAETSSVHRCGLKMQGEVQKIKIYQELLKKKLEGDHATNVCPLAVKRNWNECPYYKPR